MLGEPRKLLKAMFDAAVGAASPKLRIPAYLPPPPKGRTVVIGAGKASAAMAKAVEDLWPGPLRGLVVTRYGHAVVCNQIEIVEARHPVPDENGHRAAKRMLEMVRGLGPDDLVLALISGGGSSLLSLPAEGLTLEDKQAVNAALLRSGAAIGEMNIVRKHLSAIKGGRLAAAAYPARLMTLVISDVPGDDPAIIASGPTVPDSSTFAEARAIMEKYQITEPRSAIEHLIRATDETPKNGAPELANTSTAIIATPQLSLEAAADVARQNGVTPLILGDALEGEAREVGRVMAGIARQTALRGQPAPPPVVLLSGGETTVTVKGNGRGGRNVEFLLSLAVELDGLPGVFALAGDTDGVDGAEEIAGGIVTPDTLGRAAGRGINAKARLADNDCHSFFEALDDQVITGPTLTNVNDFRAILVLEAQEGRPCRPRHRMRRHRKAKIIATLGPASSSPEIVRSLFDAGADVFRLNFSHGTHEDHKKRYDIIRSFERDVGRPIGVLVDLQGPKLRVGTFATGHVILTTGAKFELDLDGGPGDKERVSLPHPEVFQALSPGVQLLLDDGKVRLEVEACKLGHAMTRVVVGGVLSDRKGVSVVGAVLPLSALTPKDRVDLAYGLELGADWIALSFVQRPEDVEEVRAIVAGRAGLMSKLEKPSAVEHLEAIVALSDAVMVARGDLGVEMAPEHVPPVQRQIVRACRHAGKPSIVATQMLESMIEVPTPTRAEASDVASAIYHGADAVMLSAESASGKFPLEAVTMMDRIIRAAENDRGYYRPMSDAARPAPAATIPDAISASMRLATDLLPIAAVVTYTSSGSSSLRASRERPATSILSMAASIETARRLTLAWGIHSIEVPAINSLDEMSTFACETALKEGFATKGDNIIVAAGTPIGVSGTTNMLKILSV